NANDAASALSQLSQAVNQATADRGDALEHQADVLAKEAKSAQTAEQLIKELGSSKSASERKEATDALLEAQKRLEKIDAAHQTMEEEADELRDLEQKARSAADKLEE